VAGHYTKRCGDCFSMRLRKTAEAAKANGFDAFTTTLLISPHQKHELIKETGERAAWENGVEFYYADLRKRYSDSRHITKPMELYRQQYCGCIYSEWERYTEENSKS
jgi:epoxyqueuosine reductase